LQTLPESMVNLVRLRTLKLDEKQLTVLPDWVRNLIKLQES
jgi:hypothetical protein